MAAPRRRKRLPDRLQLRQDRLDCRAESSHPGDRQRRGQGLDGRDAVAGGDEIVRRGGVDRDQVGRKVAVGSGNQAGQFHTPPRRLGVPAGGALDRRQLGKQVHADTGVFGGREGGLDEGGRGGAVAARESLGDAEADQRIDFGMCRRCQGEKRRRPAHGRPTQQIDERKHRHAPTPPAPSRDPLCVLDHLAAEAKFFHRGGPHRRRSSSLPIPSSRRECERFGAVGRALGGVDRGFGRGARLHPLIAMQRGHTTKKCGGKTSRICSTCVEIAPLRM